LSALAGRAVYIQVLANDFFQRRAKFVMRARWSCPPIAGRILDRNGVVLASSVPVPKASGPFRKMSSASRPCSRQLAKLLEMPAKAELNKRLEDEDKTFVWLKRQVDESVGKEIEALEIKGIYQRKEYKRQYPEGEAAAHVVGFTNVEDKGQEGIELAFNKDLAGRAGSRRVIKDRMGRVVEDVGEQIAPVDGRDLQLSIDSKVQFFTYQKLKDAVLAHKAKAGSVVVLDVQTGEVLALANYPSYVPDKRQNLSGEQLRNRALTDTFEPGSTMKPFVIALALDRGRVTPETPIQTAPGRMTIGSATISDSHAHGVLSVTQVIEKSSNIGTAKIALQMPARELWEMYNSVGFGQKPQLPFPGAVSGRLRPYKGWRPIEQATMSYGYGISVSLFQLAQAYSIFGRNGDRVPVSMLKVNEPPVGLPVIGERHARDGAPHVAPGHRCRWHGAQGANRRVLGRRQDRYGTQGRRARLCGQEIPWRVCRVGAHRRPAHRGGGDDRRAQQRQYFGGQVAAPVFSQTVQQTLKVLGIEPDMSVKPQIVTQAVEESF
jgi:cell division protein FtsI (penicillin-binding protein 3)